MSGLNGAEDQYSRRWIASDFIIGASVGADDLFGTDDDLLTVVTIGRMSGSSYGAALAMRAQRGETWVMRISRGNQVLGQWSPAEVKERLANKNLLPIDTFYDEELSEWLPLSELTVEPSVAKPQKRATPPCYCGSGLPFHICCGDGRKI